MHNATLSELLDKYKRVFGSDLGTAKGFKAKIIVETNATPKLLRARSIPYFYREKIEVELEKLVAEGTLTPVEHSEWAAPIVAVLTGQTVNPVAKLEYVPHPSCRRSVLKVSRWQSLYQIRSQSGLFTATPG